MTLGDTWGAISLARVGKFQGQQKAGPAVAGPAFVCICWCCWLEGSAQAELELTISAVRVALGQALTKLRRSKRGVWVIRRRVVGQVKGLGAEGELRVFVS